MPNVSADLVLTQLKWRYAVKSFDPAKKIAPEVWSQLEEALILAPSSYGLQPWKFFVVTSPDVKEKLSPASWNQPQITQCSHLVVFAVKTGMGPADAERLVKRMAEVRGVPLETLDGYKNMMSGSLSRLAPEQVQAWMTKQVYIALGVFLSAAAMMGVDACPMEGFQPEKYDEILGLSSQGYASCVLASAGYRSPDDKYGQAVKVRYAKSEVIQHI